MGWGPANSGGGSSGGTTIVNSIQALTEITRNVTVSPNSTVKLDLDVGYNKYELRTLRVDVANPLAKVIVDVFDKSTNGVSQYQSIEASNIYDIVDVPLIDKDSTNKIHISIKNTSTSVSAVTDLVIRITNLL